ncbi:MAG: hypothetical protein ACI9XO_000323 [Paraglaciecola sp.]|jgi:hypothetical protein
MKNLLNLIAATLLIFSTTSCQKDDTSTVDYPSTYIYAGIESNPTYYTYERQNGDWNRIPNSNTHVPDLFRFDTDGYFETITLDSDKEMTFIEDGLELQKDYNYSGGQLNVTYSGQPIEIEAGSFSELMVGYMSFGEFNELNGQLVSGLCGDYNICNEAGADDLVLDPGWLNDGAVTYVVIVNQRYVKQ